MILEKVWLEYHEGLNEKLWDNEELKPDIRDKLLSFGLAFLEYCRLPSSMLIDVLMTGGNANYNFTAYSDIDVHIVINRYQLGLDKQLIDEYLQDKKKLWTLTKHIKIGGYNVEPYAADLSEPFPMNQGVFSLMHNEWVRKPVNLHLNFDKDAELENKVNQYDELINHIIDAKLGKDEIKILKTKLRDMRSVGIAKEGEFSFGNLVFKSLRNEGSLDRLNAYERAISEEE